MGEWWLSMEETGQQERGEGPGHGRLSTTDMKPWPVDLYQGTLKGILLQAEALSPKLEDIKSHQCYPPRLRRKPTVLSTHHVVDQCHIYSFKSDPMIVVVHLIPHSWYLSVLIPSHVLYLVCLCTRVRGHLSAHTFFHLSPFPPSPSLFFFHFSKFPLNWDWIGRTRKRGASLLSGPLEMI